MSDSRYSRLNNQPINNKSFAEQPDFLFKVIVVGDSGVGKSCFLLRYVDDTFSDCFIATIGVDFRFKTLMSPEVTSNKLVKLQIWDTAGQDKFKFITVNYFRNSSCVLFCADLTDQRSFENLTTWNDEVRRFNPNGVVGFVVGTKSDMIDKRVVSRQQAEEYAKKLGYPYIETSSKDGTGVEKCFDALIPKMIEKKLGQHGQFEKNLKVIELNKPTKKINSNSWYSAFCNIV
jgi:Ras-related protein Rab-1A